MEGSFLINLEITRTGEVPDCTLPVPLLSEMLFEFQKSKGIDDKTRQSIHKWLDNWLDNICRDNDQFGSRRRCAFELEYRGDSDGWKTNEEVVSINTKKSIVGLVNNLVKQCR